MTKKIYVNDKPFWLYFDTFKMYRKDGSIQTIPDKFICFFKSSQPDMISLGEIIREVNGDVIIFRSVTDAENQAKAIIEIRFKAS